MLLDSNYYDVSPWSRSTWYVHHEQSRCRHSNGEWHTNNDIAFVYVRDLITAYLLGKRTVNESARRNTPRRWLTTASDCQKPRHRNPVPTAVVATDVVVLGAVDVAGALVVVAAVVVFVTVPPPEYHTCRWLAHGSQFSFRIHIGCGKTRTVGLGHVPQHSRLWNLHA